jgi:hypothetical protein
MFKQSGFSGSGYGLSAGKWRGDKSNMHFYNLQAKAYRKNTM